MPGDYFALFTQEVYNALSLSLEPEILRTPLDGPVLRILCMNESPADYLARAMHPPAKEQVEKAVSSLWRLRLADGWDRPWVTSLGRRVRCLPVEPHLGRAMVITSFFGISSLEGLEFKSWPCRLWSL